jgi:nitrogen regulatory protein PII
VVKIEAVIRPHLLDALLGPLIEAGAQGGTLSEVQGGGHEKHLEHYRGAEFEVDLHPKLKLEMVVRDRVVEQVIGTLRKGAHTGRVGDGMILVLPVLEAVRIRTGVRDDFALL